MAKKANEVSEDGVDSVNTSVIKKTLSRTISTGAYENVFVSVGFEEEITWKNIEERQKKTRAISKVLEKDLKESIVSALGSLGLVETEGIKKTGNSKTAISSKSDKEVKVMSIDDLDGV